ncbi:breast cancer 2 susceptibility protein, partial [Phenoliferia sp. Uapishka_3]
METSSCGSRERGSSATVDEPQDAEALTDQQHAALDQHRTKRPRISSPDPQHILSPLLNHSQDYHNFLDGLDPAELDLPPSSDPAPYAFPPRDPTPRFDRHPVAVRTEEPKHVQSPRRDGAAADDSGVFLVTEAGPVRVEDNDPDLAVGDEDLLGVGDGEIIMETGEVFSDLVFEGDDIWDGYEDGATLAAQVVDQNAAADLSHQEPSDPDVLREKELFGARWDVFRNPVDPTAPLTIYNASGSVVPFSEAALQKARALLDCDDETPLPPFVAPASTTFNAPRPSATSKTTYAPTYTPYSYPSTTRTPYDKSRLSEAFQPSLSPNHHSSSPEPGVMPSFGGFTSGSGAIVAGPSAAAIASINRRLNQPTTTGFKTGSGAPIVEHFSTFSPAFSPLPSFGGFTSGSGAPVVAPSAAAIAQTTERLDAPPPSFGGFTSGSGVPVAGPSAASLARAMAHLDRPSPPTKSRPRGSLPARDQDVFAGSPAGLKGKEKATFRLPGGQGLSSEAEAETVQHVESPSSSRSIPRGTSSPTRSPTEAPAASPLLQASPPRPTPRERPPSATPLRPKATLGTPRPKPFRGHAVTPLPFNSPMLSSKKAPNASTSMLPPASATPLRATPDLRRLNLAMTPRPRVSHVHKFVTPFKGGVRPPGLAPTGLPASISKVTTASANDNGKGKEKEAELVAEKRKFVSVFDLLREILSMLSLVILPKLLTPTAKGSRQGLAAAGFRPQTHFYEHLIGEGLPEEALAMDSQSAASFVFQCGRGQAEALTALEDAGCSLATSPWIDNHWGLIVWKLASLTRTRPDFRSTYWHWQAAVDQLKYRYEREINQAQRSCVKRIQEQDSSAGHPMVLCVSQIRWGDASDASAGPEVDVPLSIIGLELTDGWYRIRSNVDATLRDACQRGKIVVGSKLSLVGAKLTIFGNSTSLAPWDAKLGWVRHPFVSTLGRLTSAGGNAPLLDIIIERAFPCGYLDMSRNSQHETWNAEEEKIRADEWAVGREQAEGRLADELEKTKGDWDDIIALLQEASHRIGLPTSSPDPDSIGEEPDEILDRLEDASNKAAIISHLSAAQLSATLKLAFESSVRDKHQAVSDIELELATVYPPRNVRAFRVLRIRDAQIGTRPIARTAQLTVWDAEALGKDFFQENQRYLVSNVLPKGSWRRNALEIALATRRDSKWEKVE